MFTIIPKKKSLAKDMVIFIFCISFIFYKIIYIYLSSYLSIYLTIHQVDTHQMCSLGHII